VSGHTEASYAPVLAGLVPGSVTVVVLMGLGARAAIAKSLIARGWDPGTPAAIVAGAATADAWRWLGRLDGLGAAEPPSGPPGLLVIGAVASLAPVLQARFGQLAPENRERDAANE
jgi:uroporphyrin-III C-methyltransferase / precorrin-2 dehydrogenase / sirohydrochlorin ferrochelatase